MHAYFYVHAQTELDSRSSKPLTIIPFFLAANKRKQYTDQHLINADVVLGTCMCIVCCVRKNYET
jgi:hypothetical protein